nr:pentapeptide repeat-containing protein [uncultured Psychroserpens sp.]
MDKRYKKYWVDYAKTLEIELEKQNKENKKIPFKSLNIIISICGAIIIAFQTFLFSKQTDMLGNQLKLSFHQDSLSTNQVIIAEEQNKLFDNQNKLFNAQNDIIKKQYQSDLKQIQLISNQNSLLSKQNEKIDLQSNLIEANRRSSSNILFSDVLNQISSELSTNTDRTLSDVTINRIISLSQAFKPYRLLYKGVLKNELVSPERGQLLTFLINNNLNEDTYERIFAKANFKYSDLSETSVTDFTFKNIDLSNSFFNESKFERVEFIDTKLTNSYIMFADFLDVLFSNSNMTGINFTESKIITTSFIECNLNNVNFTKANLENSYFQGIENITGHLKFIVRKYQYGKDNKTSYRDALKKYARDDRKINSLNILSKGVLDKSSFSTLGKNWFRFHSIYNPKFSKYYSSTYINNPKNFYENINFTKANLTLCSFKGINFNYCNFESAILPFSNFNDVNFIDCGLKNLIMNQFTIKNIFSNTFEENGISKYIVTKKVSIKEQKPFKITTVIPQLTISHIEMNRLSLYGMMNQRTTDYKDFLLDKTLTPIIVNFK